MVLCGLIWVSLIGKFVLQLQMMLLVDCTITNIQNFILEKIVDCVPDVKIWMNRSYFGYAEEIFILGRVQIFGTIKIRIASAFKEWVHFEIFICEKSPCS